MARIFLDHNATTPLKPAVREAMIAAMDAGNPSSVHTEGRKAKGLLEQSRQELAQLVDAPTNGLVFTGGGTEAINMALWGMVRRAENPVRHLYISATEHDAVINCAEAIEKSGLATKKLMSPLLSGAYDADQLLAELQNREAQKDGAFMVCLMLANNETGVIQDLAPVRREIFARGGFLFVDAAQAVGKIDVSFNDLQADLMSIAGHKFGGPKGVGALATKPGIPLEPLMQGGGQELRRRAGTENMIAIAGLGAAARAADMQQMADLKLLRDKLETGLNAIGVEGLKIWGAATERLPNTTCFSAPGFSSETQVMAMDLAGIAVSSGSACSSGKVKASHVLTAMGASEEDAASALRVSLGWDTTEEMIDLFIEKWGEAYARARRGKAA
ncbi:cysteine desulfurase family protein [Parvularcula sp. IMCC14364]|uniref:cysteine desulfurase family protein n=1 Tax=Parvularcula sp. IMCC14364 TaxID=3067902 RepID=UPI0027422D20|nr:cysteine desulfurase family protein [Parvularcula sp. IMCC14364]